MTNLNISSLLVLQSTLLTDTLMGFAVALILAALCGEYLYRKLGWPRIMGYVLVGLVSSMAGIGYDEASLPAEFRVVMDLALALLLFELGVRINLKWLKANPWLIATSLFEASLSFAVVMLVLHFFGLEWRASMAIATICMATSPAIVMRVVSESRAEGQISERLTLLTGLNSIYAILATKVVMSWVQIGMDGALLKTMLQPAYALFGALLLAVVLTWAMLHVVRYFKLSQENSLLLIFGLLLLTTTVARVLQVSVILVPLLAGILLRSQTDRPLIWPRHFGTAGGILVALLFVFTGLSIRPQLFLTGGLAAVALILLRAGAKTAGVVVFAHPSGLTLRQGLSLGLALSPLSAVAFSQVVDFQSLLPEFSGQLAPFVLSAVAFTELLGPLLVLWALRRCNETHIGDVD
ncbi:MAG: cation:proton antiporter [Formivibrio sp.]|nr:cation:proton antiporter [Formivibrio sp.]